MFPFDKLPTPLFMKLLMFFAIIGIIGIVVIAGGVTYFVLMFT